MDKVRCNSYCRSTVVISTTIYSSTYSYYLCVVPVRRLRAENLQAFWPGMEAMMGLTGSSATLLNAFYSVWNTFDTLPEEFDSSLWADKIRSKGLQGNIFYPLRPELIESTYYHYRATKDPSVGCLLTILLYRCSIYSNYYCCSGYSPESTS
jgi:hypothetical protein